MVFDTRTRLYFISFAVQTLLLGIFLSATSVSLYLTFYGPSHRAFRDKFVLAGISVLIISAISHWGISLAAMHTALFTQSAEHFDGRYSINLHNPYLEAQMYLNDVSLGVTDALFIYRLYVVWQDQPIVVAPPLLSLVGAIVTVAILARSYHQAAGALSPDLASKATTAIVLAISMNAYCTVMITWRIWHAGKISKRVGGTSFSTSLVILVESAGAYLAYMIVLLVLYTARKPAFFIFIDCNVVFSALAYMLINVRVALGIAHQQAPTQSSALQWATASQPADAVVAFPSDLDEGAGDSTVKERNAATTGVAGNA
ncbi:hypothetical protein EV714DRAFT_271308 [Schizophyllum commune]